MTDSMKRLVVILILIVSICVVSYAEYDYQSDNITEVWVLCHPESYVNARLFPTKDGDIIGRLEVSYKLYTDGKTKNGFLHCIGASLESSEVWVYKGYLVYDDPVKVNEKIGINCRGKVIARKYINGRKRCYVSREESVLVYYAGFDWCITNKGYIRTKYLDIDVMQYALNNQ